MGTASSSDTPADAAPRDCQSCGDVDVDLALVRRLWVTPEDWDTEAKVSEGDLEWWCFVCRSHYPHQEANPAEAPNPPA
jgi:hypothetical protein